LNVRAALQWAKLQLSSSDTASLDASLLLARSIQLSREKLLAEYDLELEEKQWISFQKDVEKRSTGYNLSYILGTQEFYGRNFQVNESVLIPRPETELLIDLAIQRADKGKVLDLCCGSGCIAVTMKKESPELEVWASDISHKALQVARQNAERLQAEIHFLHSNLFNEIDGRFHMILTNPPYVADREVESMKASGNREPELALSGGEKGWELPKTLLQQAMDYLIPNGYLLMEIGWDQGRVLQDFSRAIGYGVAEIHQDYAGKDRVLEVRR
jgi:release factor glutamine methyltransferase